MPFGGNDWLALTQEPTLEPDLPVCDPHHHRRNAILFFGAPSAGEPALEPTGI